jgi:hypothetical protein
MRNAAKWIGTFGLLFVLGSSAAGEEPAAGPKGKSAAAPASQSSDDIDPAQVKTMKPTVIPDDFVSHKGPDGEFSIKSPPSWKAAPAVQGSAVLVLKSDTPGASVNVVVVPSPPGESLKAAMEALPQQLEKQFKGFKLIDSDYVLYCGRPSGRVVYEVEIGNGQRVRIMQIFVLRGVKDYVVTFAAPANVYDEAFKEAEPVIASFDLAGAEPTSQPAR